MDIIYKKNMAFLRRHFKGESPEVRRCLSVILKIRDGSEISREEFKHFLFNFHKLKSEHAKKLDKLLGGNNGT